MIPAINDVLPSNIKQCKRCQGEGCETCKNSGYIPSHHCYYCKTKLKKIRNDKFYCRICNDTTDVYCSYFGRFWT